MYLNIYEQISKRFYYQAKYNKDESKMFLLLRPLIRSYNFPCAFAFLRLL